MQFQRFIRSGLFAVGVALSILKISAADVPREHLSLDANWKFHLGDDWPGALHLDKAGASTGPASEKFGDAAWRALDLPHDWAIELPFDKTSDTSHGFKPVGRFIERQLNRPVVRQVERAPRSVAKFFRRGAGARARLIKMQRARPIITEIGRAHV